MALALSIFILNSILVIGFTLKKPIIRIKKFSFQTFYLFPLIISLGILGFKLLPFNELKSVLLSNSSFNPLKIIILFFAMSGISIILDMLGFFKFLASYFLAKFNSSQIVFFNALYVLIALLTIFTSNDIVILTFTPFIIHFARMSKINPLPYLFMQFIVANTASMVLLIGNPTNIYLASSHNVTFVEYLKLMLLPSLIATILAYVLVYFKFSKDLKGSASLGDIEEVKLENKLVTSLEVAILLVVTIFLVISNYLNLEMYLISLVGFILSLIIYVSYVLRKHQNEKIRLLVKRLPFSLCLFVLAMFVIVLNLNYHQVDRWLLSVFDKLFVNKFTTIFGYGLLATLMDNLINNIPMSILFSSLTTSKESLYAIIIGSNIGAYVSPLGALAGIMWLNILKNYGINLSFKDFVKKIGFLAFPILFSALLTLYFTL